MMMKMQKMKMAVWMKRMNRETEIKMKMNINKIYEM